MTNRVSVRDAMGATRDSPEFFQNFFRTQMERGLWDQGGGANGPSLGVPSWGWIGCRSALERSGGQVVWPIDPAFQRLRWSEHDDIARRNRMLVSGPRVAANSITLKSDRERTELGELDRFVLGQAVDNRIERLFEECQRRSKISPPGRSKTSPLNVMRYAVLGGGVPVVHRRDPRCFV